MKHSIQAISFSFSGKVFLSLLYVSLLFRWRPPAPSSTGGSSMETDGTPWCPSVTPFHRDKNKRLSGKAAARARSRCSTSLGVDALRVERGGSLMTTYTLGNWKVDFLKGKRSHASGFALAFLTHEHVCLKVCVASLFNPECVIMLDGVRECCVW